MIMSLDIDLFTFITMNKWREGRRKCSVTASDILHHFLRYPQGLDHLFFIYINFFGDLMALNIIYKPRGPEFINPACFFHELLALITKCLPDSSIWVFIRCYKFNMSKIKLLVFLPTLIIPWPFFFSVDGNFFSIYFCQKTLRVIHPLLLSFI